MSVKIEILDYVYTDSSNTVIDWDKSIVGELDITDHSDFPLAMTFQISDFKSLTSTSGDYSKTFKIPATKNNNKIFKNIYIPNIDVDNEVTSKKPCRIMVNNLYSKVGLIKINGVSGYGENPSHYDCVFFGSNLSWAADMEDTYMNDIDWGSDGIGLTYNKASIMTTWNDVDCTTSSSHIVYPITSYGVYNEGGYNRTIQLLDTKNDGTPANCSACLGYFGFTNSNVSYGTPPPSPDWRPSVFVKNTLDKIFAGIGNGFKINSNFMDTPMFKKLVWLLPNFKYNNPDERYSLYSLEANFNTSVVLPVLEMEATWADATSPSYEYDSDNIELGVQGTSFTLSNTTASTEITYIGSTDSYFKVAEYGNYTIKASGLSAKLSNLLQDGAIPIPSWIMFNSASAASRNAELYIDRIQFRLQVQTVGQTSWNNISLAENTTTEAFVGSYGTYGNMGVNLIDTTNSYTWDVSDDIEIERLYLNKNDRVRISFYAKFKPHTTAPSWTGEGNWSFDVTPTIKDFDISFANVYVEYGQTYDLSEVMSADYKQIDFIKGVAHAFNLQMTTNEAARTVDIEPFNEFYKPLGDAIDWTYKLDRSKEISDKWLESDLKRTLVFKYKSDSNDAMVKYRGGKYFDEIEDEYPYKEELPNTFEKGDSTFENPFFAGSYNAKDLTSSGTSSESNDPPYSACLWTEIVSANDSGRPSKGNDFVPRLLYWNKYSPVGTFGSGVATPKRGQVQTWAITSESVVADSTANTGVLYNIYPQATMINRDSTTSPVLSYGNVWNRDYDDATGTYTAYQTGSGLYDTYYRHTIEMLKKKPRLRNVYINLKVSDIINLDFRKLIYIDGSYWRISKISDYMPNKNESTKVELIEWFALSVYPATAPMVGSSGSLLNWGSSPSDPEPVIPDNL